MKARMVSVLVAMFLFCGMLLAQTPVEIFAGHNKATVDIMFFKFIENSKGDNSKFLFFNRNRASVDYKMKGNLNLPQFGFTEAISYNHPSLKGFAPVVVASILNKAVVPKAGFQYAKMMGDLNVFTWLVTETWSEPNMDVFFLGRYTPRLSNKLKWFMQVELIGVFPTARKNVYSFTQRTRLGIKSNALQLGIGLDLLQLGRNDFTQTENFGGYLRYEF